MSIYMDGDLKDIYTDAVNVGMNCPHEPELLWDANHPIDHDQMAAQTKLVHIWVHALRILAYDAAKNQRSICRIAVADSRQAFRWSPEAVEFMEFWEREHEGFSHDLIHLLAERAISYEISHNGMHDVNRFYVSAEAEAFLQEVTGNGE